MDKRISILLIGAMLMGGISTAGAADIDNQLYISVKHTLPYPKTYNLRFSLWDAETEGILVWSEGDAAGDIKLNITSAKINTYIGALVPLVPADFNQQLWLQIDRWKAAASAWVPIGARTKLGVVAYALHSATSEIDPNVVQSRVSGSCEPGFAIRSILTTGSVVCEDVRPTFIMVTGAPVTLGATAGSTAIGSADCPAGYTVIGGGCYGYTSVAIGRSAPTSAPGWSCFWNRIVTIPNSNDISAYASCVIQ